MYECACVCLCLCWPRGLLQNFYCHCRCRCRCRYTSLIFSISISILFLSSRSTSRWTWTWMSMSMWLATFPMFFSLSTHLCVALASPSSLHCSPPLSCSAFQNINSKRIARIEIVKCHLIVAVFLSFPFSIFCFSFFIFYYLCFVRRQAED